jgi:hypothetical protein
VKLAAAAAVVVVVMVVVAEVVAACVLFPTSCFENKTTFCLNSTTTRTLIHQAA